MSLRNSTVSLLAVVLVLSGCGGSSSGGNNNQPPTGGNPPTNPPTTPPTTPPTPGPDTPLPIDPDNSPAVLALPTAFAESLVELSTIVVDALILASEQREAMVSLACDSGSFDLSLTDLNLNGLPSANEMASLSMSNCQFAGSNIAANGTLDIEIRSFVVESNLSAKAKVRVSTNGPVALSVNGTSYSATGAYEISYLGDDLIQTLDLAGRFADTLTLQDDAGQDETFSSFAVMRTISATSELSTAFTADIESESLVGAVSCATTTNLTGPLGNVPGEGIYVCNGDSQSAAQAFGTLGGNVQLGVDDDGDGTFEDVPTPTGNSGTWADFFSNNFFALAVRSPGVVPAQLLATLNSISAAYSANDIVVSPDGSTIYLSDNTGIRKVSAIDLTEIDQLTLPATPGPLAISDDGSTLWIGFSGAQRIQSIDLGNFTAGAQVPLGTSPTYASRLATELAVAPGQPQVVVVSMANRNELVAYSAGTALANIVSDARVPSAFAFVSPTEIAGIDTDTTTATVIRLDADGLSLAEDDVLRGFEVNPDTSIDSGQYIYSTSGRAFDPLARVVHGRIKLNQTQNVRFRDGVAVDEAADVVYMYNHNLGLLEGYGAESLVLLNAYGIDSNGGFVAMADAGTGLVLATDSELVRVEKSDIVPNRNSSLCIAFALSGVIADGFFSEIDCGFNDIVYSSVNNSIYAAMPSFAGVNGNSIATINPATGEIVSTLLVGSEPSSLAMTPDETLLYVTFREASRIAVVDLAQGTVSSYINLSLAETNGRPMLAADVAVSPTANDAILVAWRNEVVSYVAGVKQGAALTGFVNNIDSFFKANGTEALVQEVSGRLSKLAVDAAGVSSTGSENNLVAARSLKYVGDTLYDRNGRIVAEPTATVRGTCMVNHGAGTLLVEPASNSDAVYYIDQSVESIVTTCDETTFAITSQRTLPSFGETLSVPKVLVEAGNNKLVLGTSDKLVVFDPTGIR